MAGRLTVADDGSTLADALVAFERRIVAEHPETVVVEDDSEAALAAVLAALKLGVAVEPGAGATEGESDNARVIGQLTRAPSRPTGTGPSYT